MIRATDFKKVKNKTTGKVHAVLAGQVVCASPMHDFTDEEVTCKTCQRKMQIIIRQEMRLFTRIFTLVLMYQQDGVDPLPDMTEQEHVLFNSTILEDLQKRAGEKTVRLLQCGTIEDIYKIIRQ